MKGGYPHAVGVISDQRHDPLLHLPGSLVGKGYCKDIVWIDISFGYQVCDPVCERTGLSRSRTRKDKEWSVRCGYCCLLLPVQAVYKTHQTLSLMAQKFQTLILNSVTCDPQYGQILTPRVFIAPPQFGQLRACPAAPIFSTLSAS